MRGTGYGLRIMLYGYRAAVLAPGATRGETRATGFPHRYREIHAARSEFPAGARQAQPQTPVRSASGPGRGPRLQFKTLNASCLGGDGARGTMRYRVTCRAYSRLRERFHDAHLTRITLRR